jgi:hypothetical protein
MTRTASDLFAICLAKGPERYLFLFNEESRVDACRTAIRFWFNEELSFDAVDAGEVIEQIRGTVR